ncbi:unnamed protein product [Clonostachys rosea]|uniref:glutathione transferase n=1 Tax=Bionectria ochroleuca TaxID=29856 RepID=A0ABY6U1S4_BIOOC|nr:unnamed protein product [Clonostachys rosea]
MTPTKAIRVWLTPPGPNSWKVVNVIEELGVPYEFVSFKFEHVKSPPFININPNGRVPAIEDPNTDITLWETGAIIQYLISQYDPNKLLHYDTLKEHNLCIQWLSFQISGQGPYFGQCGWFSVLHPEKIPSAIERYQNELKRILGVLETVLASRPADQQWLVGDRITFADLSFVPYNDRVDVLLGVPADKKFESFPHVKAWHEKMIARPAWIKSMEHRARLMDEQGLDWHGLPKGVANIEEFEKSLKQGEE